MCTMKLLYGFYRYFNDRNEVLNTLKCDYQRGSHTSTRLFLVMLKKKIFLKKYYGINIFYTLL